MRLKTDVQLFNAFCSDRLHLHTHFFLQELAVGCKEFNLVVENACLFTRKAEISTTVDMNNIASTLIGSSL